MFRLTVLFLSFCTLSFVGYSQEKVNYANLKSHRVDDGFVRFQVEEFNPDKKNKYKKDLNYFWYKSQNVMSTQGGSSGLLLHGIYEKFYNNKQLAIKGNFKKGLKHGKWTYWNDQGRMIKEEFWRKGKPKKSAVNYSVKGEVKKEKNYSKDEIVYNKKDEIIKTNMDSTSVEIIKKDQNGQTTSVERYKKGKLHGKQLNYDENGRLSSFENYKNGELHGKQKLPDGSTVRYKKGVLKEPLLKRLFKGKDKEENEDEDVKDEQSDKKNSKKEKKGAKKDKKSKEKKTKP
ncbi:MAG: hypothetical protein WED10_05260 [Brumimicrobium sp.]